MAAPAAASWAAVTVNHSAGLAVHRRRSARRRRSHQEIEFLKQPRHLPLIFPACSPCPKIIRGADAHSGLDHGSNFVRIGFLMCGKQTFVDGCRLGLHNDLQSGVRGGEDSGQLRNLHLGTGSRELGGKAVAM